MKVAMDNLIRAVKMSATSHPLPCEYIFSHPPSLHISSPTCSLTPLLIYSLSPSPLHSLPLPPSPLTPSLPPYLVIHLLSHSITYSFNPPHYTPHTDFAPDMLLCCHHLTLATMDFLMVAQCASLTHRILIVGWDLMQLPWVRVYAGSGEVINTLWKYTYPCSETTLI